ncbi:alpha-ketoglutarate dehydrogenase [Roseinatronobacter sp. S2]|uniref:alpha-ketoglutarate dehydrogenase n=1 Tax=Roseinatronobacter sp. S2 TaxID=3035471 RepID=UPI0024104163|nr:alpha-ketoglutarate dehydrogenase [Roseinatronobacter sp. S2]WFE76976.1 alpha-ketoglutarate dehydrogenase [Roseinatronobacter sp. S2]
MNNASPHHDTDPQETREWLDAFRAVSDVGGGARAGFLLGKLEEAARRESLYSSGQPYSSYRNTIPLAKQGAFPGDLEIEERLTAIMRWNALAMVVRANKAYGELGGHIASYASAAEIFETGFNHFFRAETPDFGGDLVYFQPHSAPGVYARAFLEGRLSETQLANYRQETHGNGLCSYPHPWLMPDFWQFPTGSMGIGPINAVYQARFMRYLHGRSIVPTNDRHVWGVFGDGEMDEPESIAGLTLAAREKLDNLTFIINCNLQRLDGPVRGNGQIIQELESLFLGAGWNVIKVLWGSEWDSIFDRDTEMALLSRFAQTVDGEYQDLGSKAGDYNRERFFNRDPATRALVEHMTDAEIHALRRGGHDIRKLYAAFAAAKAHKGRPTVILAKTKKGFGMGNAGESRMTAHQSKKLDMDALIAFRDRFALPLSESDLAELRFYKPAPDSAEMAYLNARRAALGGSIPKRRQSTDAARQLAIPKPETYASFARTADGKEMSTTMALVRMLGALLKDKTFGPHIVPIVADEARTFGMDNLFRQIGIYAPEGQLYQPEDAGSMMFYKEAQDGQLLEEGITEAGALSSWAAAGTAYSVHDVPMIPFYIYYSMFGFQRVGDLIWAAADQRARGFLIGATAGRTTLSGEGLQHQDGTSHLSASTIPNCRAYDPAFAGELAAILDHGMRRMLEKQQDEFYYITVMNETYAQPSLKPGAEADVIKGLYLFDGRGNADAAARVRLVGSGAILNEVIAAADILNTDYGIASDIFSATSWSELERDARAIERENRFTSETRISHVAELLSGDIPVVAASDYVRAVPGLIAPYLAAPMTILGTDGFGRSSNRTDLRDFFEVDRKNIAFAAVTAMVQAGHAPAEMREQALQTLNVNKAAPPPWTL